MKTSLPNNNKFGIIGVVLLLWSAPIDLIQEQAVAQFTEAKKSVGIVSNVSGEVLLTSIEESSSSKPIVLQGKLVYGDRITTRQNSVLSMLVGEDALVCLDEFSEISLEQDTNGGRLLQLTNGRACISTIGEEGADIDLSVQTPATTLNPSPGTLFSVKVSSPAKEEDQHALAPHALLTGYNERGSALTPRTVSHIPQPKTEIIQVIQGSVEVISQIPGIPAVVVLEGFQVTVRRGVIGALVKESAVQCQMQDLQESPQHTNNSKEIQALISEQQSAQATYLVAALFNSPNQPNTFLTDQNKDIVIIPGEEVVDTSINTPRLFVPGDQNLASLDRELRVVTLPSSSMPEARVVGETDITTNTDIVQIVGPGAVEINTSTLTVENSQVTSSSGTNGLSLVSVMSGGLLRGISQDPVIDITDSQITTQAAVNVSGGMLPDLSLIEASAPLVSVLSTDPNNVRSTLMTNDTIQINGAQLGTSIPADALVTLNGSTLSTIGAVVSLSNGGLFTHNGTLIALSNGSELMAESLVELSGASTFALTGGFLLSSIGSNSVGITNTLCQGGGCISGFISAPGTNDITVAPGFTPTQGVTVPAGAALIVVNGDGNTVVLQ